MWAMAHQGLHQFFPEPERLLLNKQFGFGQKKVTTNSLPDNFSFQEILTYSCSTDLKLHVNGVFSAETYSWEKVRLNIESSVTR